jgi:aminoglycoside phosphotransferase (APT) family kinase protein
MPALNQIQPDSEFDHILRLAFGQPVPYTPVPLAPGQSESGAAFALHGPGVPPYVILIYFPTRQHAHAFRAFTAINALLEQQFPVPRAYFLGWGRQPDHVYLLLEHVAGRRVAGQAHGFFARVGTHFAETLAGLHHLSWGVFPDLPVLPLHYAFHEMMVQVRRLETWQLQVILSWLLERLDHVEELPRTVIHGDYTLQHIVADPPDVLAVGGWDHAAIADPRFDVGYASALLGAYGTTLSDQFLDAYERVSGPIEYCEFWETLCALRVLVRVARTVSNLNNPQRGHFLNQVVPIWSGLLRFVEARTDMRLTE